MINFKSVFSLLFFTIFCTTIQAQELNKKQIKFLKKNGHPVILNNHSSVQPIPALEKALQNKRIVLLGEFTHGAKEINLVKNGLIKYLHEQLGYKVLLFESGMGELMGIELDRTEKSPLEFLRMGLFGPWRTKEYLELMAYIKEKETLKVGGFDVQRSGPAFAGYFNEVVEAAEIKDIEKPQKLEDSFSAFVNYMRSNDLDSIMVKQKETLTLHYQKLHSDIDKYRAVATKNGIPLQQIQLVLKTIENRLAYLEYYFQFKKDNDYGKRWAARDSIMADNIIWFAEHIYPGEKIMINAHNFHISKYNEKELTLGEVLFEKYSTDMYAIGVFGGKGERADNYRKPRELSPIIEINDIKRFVNNSPAENTFISIPKSVKKEGEWLHREVIVEDSFLDLYGGNTLVPEKCFDGLLFIKHISLPDYL